MNISMTGSLEKRVRIQNKLTLFEIILIKSTQFEIGIRNYWVQNVDERLLICIKVERANGKVKVTTLK